ncbi:hypothetical protein CEP52_015599 [Fusarium oligoseptatum]|uniref:Uncharacterized protein n=2 Tax=Fusarium solani species complex TaxID=232080 RepID=A0A428SBL8_9HYPO|nr:hypothetical protein CEP51_013327 [Fusarium floridanum]RSL87161.1 hypothetical protein CEP52_015599 [Fusarium oligoseptatum]
MGNTTTAVAIPTVIGSMILLAIMVLFLFTRNRHRDQTRVDSDGEAFWDLDDSPKKAKTNIGVVASAAPKASAWLEKREIRDRVKVDRHFHAVHINPQADHPLIDAWLVLGSIDRGLLEELVATRKPLDGSL